MSASATVQVGASHATVSSNGLLRFGYTNITDRAHLFSDSLQFKEDGTIHVWRDRAAFPLVEISWQGDAAELPSDNHLVWTVLYSDDGSRVDRCRKCPATHMLGFRLSHPPNKVVAWGTPVENDCVTPITSNNHNNIALGMAGPDIFPSMRFGNIPTTGCLASSHKMFLLCNSHFHDQRLFKVRVSIVDGATNTVVASVDSAPMKVVSKFLKGRKKSRSKICSTPAVVLPGALARSGSFSSSGFVSDDATAPMPARSRLARRVRPPARFSDSFRGPLGDLVEDDAEDDYDDDGERVSVKANDDNDSAHTRSDFSATVSDEDLVSSASGRKRTASVANHSHNAPHVGTTDFYDNYGVAANVRSASATADVTDLGEERPAKRQKSGGGGSGGFTLPQLDTHDHSSDMDDRPRFRPTSAGPTKSASPSEFKSPVAAVGDDRRASYDDLVVFDLAAAELAQRASSESVPDAKHPGMPAPSTPLSLRSTSPAPAPTGSRVSPRFLTNADKKSEILALFSELDFASKVSVFDRLVEVPAARAWPAMQQCIFNHGLQYEIMQAEAPLQKAYQNVLEILRNTPKGNRPPLPMCESVLATLFDGTEAELSATAL